MKNYYPYLINKNPKVMGSNLLPRVLPEVGYPRYSFYPCSTVRKISMRIMFRPVKIHGLHFTRSRFESLFIGLCIKIVMYSPCSCMCKYYYNWCDIRQPKERKFFSSNTYIKYIYQYIFVGYIYRYQVRVP